MCNRNVASCVAHAQRRTDPLNYCWGGGGAKHHTHTHIYMVIIYYWHIHRTYRQYYNNNVRVAFYPIRAIHAT